MPQETYNPISEAFDFRPPQNPGTVLVGFADGVVKMVGSDTYRDIKNYFSLERYIEPYNGIKIGLIAVVLVIIIWIVGLIVTVILFVAAVAGIAWLVANRHSAVATMLFGSLPKYYLVDISRRIVRDERRTQLSDAGVYVVVQFEYRATVINPEKVVASGVKDVREYLSDKFYVDIDARARSGTLKDELAGFRRDLSTLFGQPKADELIRVEAVTFDLIVEGAPGRALAKLSEESIRQMEIQAQGRLDAAERENLVQVISNDELLLAEVMRSDDKRVHELIKLRMDQQNIGFQRNLALFKVALEEGVLEAHQIKKEYPTIYEALTKVLPRLVVDPNPKLEKPKARE